MISSQRLKEQLAHLQTLTTPEGKGINRLAFSDADWQGRAYLMSLMREARPCSAHRCLWQCNRTPGRQKRSLTGYYVRFPRRQCTGRRQL